MSVSTLALVAESWRRTCVVGHRGSASTHPENTLAAFEEGIAAGADAVECDVHVCLDGGLAILHDDTLDRTTSLCGPVSQVTSQELRMASVPLLHDLTAVTRNRSVLAIELKRGEALDRKVVDHIQAEGLVDQAILFSFEPAYLAAADKLNPHLFTTFLIGQKLEVSDLDRLFDQMESIGADGVGTDYRNCPPELVREAHDRGMPVFTWTVPPGPEVERLRDLSVNFIITDHPRQVVGACRPLRAVR